MKFKEIISAVGLSPKTLDAAKSAIATAQPALDSVAALFTAANLDIDALLGAGPDALKTHLSTAHQTALDGVKAELSVANEAKGVLDAALTEAKTAKATAEAALAARDGVITSTLAEAGIKVEKLEAATIKTALKSRIESEAQTLLAARGIKPLPEKLSNGTEINANLETDEQVAEAYLQMKPGSAESVAFVEKHKEALWRIQSKRK